MTELSKLINNYDHLGHKFNFFIYIYVNNHVNNIHRKEHGKEHVGWHKCLVCGVCVYTDYASFGNKFKAWDTDLFHNNTIGHPHKLIDFNFTCEEIIIKKIIE